MNYLNKEDVVNAVQSLFPDSLVSLSWAKKEESFSTTLNVQFCYTITAKEVENVTK